MLVCTSDFFACPFFFKMSDSLTKKVYNLPFGKFQIVVIFLTYHMLFIEFIYQLNLKKLYFIIIRDLEQIMQYIND